MQYTLTKKMAIRTISDHRELLEITQTDAAGYAGISQPAWSSIVAGDIDPLWETVLCMAAAVGIDARLKYDVTKRTKDKIRFLYELTASWD